MLESSPLQIFCSFLYADLAVYCSISSSFHTHRAPYVSILFSY